MNYKMKNLISIGVVALISSFSTLSTAQTSKQVASKNYALSLAKKYCTNAYEIIKQDDAKTVSFWMDGKTKNVGPNDFGTVVHECLHEYDHKIGREKGYNHEKGMWHQGFFIDKDMKFTILRPKVFATEKLHPQHYPKGLHKAGRYKTYVTGTASSNDRGIYGLMEEFNAYMHDNRAMLEMLQGGEKMRFMGEIEENMTTNMVSSYFEFNIFMAGYLKYAKKHNSQDYKTIMRHKKFRLVYTLIEANFRDVLTEIYSDPKIAKYFPDDLGEDKMFNAELQSIMNDFMLHGEELGKYQSYVANLKYDQALILKNRNRKNLDREGWNTYTDGTAHNIGDDHDHDMSWDSDDDGWGPEDDSDENEDWTADQWDELKNITPDFSNTDNWDITTENEDGSTTRTTSTTTRMGSREEGQHYVVIKTFNSISELLNYQWNSRNPLVKTADVLIDNRKYYMHVGSYSTRNEAEKRQAQIASYNLETTIF